MKTAVTVSSVNMEERKNLGLRSGDTVRVWQNIVELKTGKGANKKEVTTKNVRRQAFEGLVLAVKHGGEAGGTFTVRRVASGVGVEKIFPLFSPMIDKIEILRRSEVRQAKLYHIRDKVAREVRRQMRKMHSVNLSTGSGVEEAALAKAAAEAAAAAETVSAE